MTWLVKDQIKIIEITISFSPIYKFLSHTQPNLPSPAAMKLLPRFLFLFSSLSHEKGWIISTVGRIPLLGLADDTRPTPHVTGEFVILSRRTTMQKYAISFFLSSWGESWQISLKLKFIVFRSWSNRRVCFVIFFWLFVYWKFCRKRKSFYFILLSNFLPPSIVEIHP